MRLTWKQTCARLRVDHARLLLLLAARHPDPPRRAWLHPSFVCVFLYRISNYFYRSDHKWLARILWHANLLLTGADISEPADLGEGLVICSPAGVAIMGTAGRNLTVMACAGLGAELGRHEDIGAGPGFCLIGDDVTLEPHSGILGPVRAGNRVRVGAGIALTHDVPDDTIVQGPPPRFIRRGGLP
jgi:serine O-acetyltransferase